MQRWLSHVLPRSGGRVSIPELSGVAALLGSPLGATIGWLHFLVFDLFVGRWMYLDSRDRAIPAWVMTPVLFLTLMLGPCGFLLYLLVRQTKGFNQETVRQSPVRRVLQK